MPPLATPTIPSKATSSSNVSDPLLVTLRLLAGESAKSPPVVSIDPPFTVTLPADWTVQYGHVYHSNQDEDDEFGFYAVVVDGIWADACAGSDSGDPIEVGPTVDDLAAALLEQPGPTASGPIATTLGGDPATRIDLTVPEGFNLEPCNASGIGLQIWYTAPADKNFVLTPDGSASAYILDVDGKRQVFLTQHGATTSDEDLAQLQAVLDSIRIE